MIATIGTSNPPKLMTESMNLFTHASVANDYRLPANHGFLVELTGIEPVASWLQTRRSPS
jgi:hypothetical protein